MARVLSSGGNNRSSCRSATPGSFRVQRTQYRSSRRDSAGRIGISKHAPSGAHRIGAGYSGRSIAAKQYGKKTDMSTSAASSSPFRLDGRQALVTGGASGIGEATVKELVRAGAFVWVADINRPAAESLAAAVGSAQALQLDVTSLDSITAAAAQVKRLDILVNN